MKQYDVVNCLFLSLICFLVQKKRLNCYKFTRILNIPN